jgi:hypothetical protein
LFGGPDTKHFRQRSREVQTRIKRIKLQTKSVHFLKTRYKNALSAEQMQKRSAASTNYPKAQGARKNPTRQRKGDELDGVRPVSVRATSVAAQWPKNPNTDESEIAAARPLESANDLAQASLNPPLFFRPVPAQRPAQISVSEGSALQTQAPGVT